MKTKAKPQAADHVAFAHHLADLAGAAILPYFRRSLTVDNKAASAGFDPVTAADRAAERVMRSAIENRYPDHAILGEEMPERLGEGRYRWVLDPIDGTRAFITGNPLWGTLIGMTDGGHPTVGLMDQPFTRERFWAAGGKAHMRGPDGKARRIKTRACASLADAVLGSTHPDLFARAKDAAAFARLRKNVRMTRFGGDCYGYCMLAAGFVDLVVESGLKPYDVVALIPIIEGAGGRITTWDGKPCTEGGNIVAAGDPRAHEAALEILG